MVEYTNFETRFGDEVTLAVGYETGGARLKDDGPIYAAFDRLNARRYGDHTSLTAWAGDKISCSVSVENHVATRCIIEAMRHGVDADETELGGEARL